MKVGDLVKSHFSNLIGVVVEPHTSQTHPKGMWVVHWVNDFRHRNTVGIDGLRLHHERNMKVIG